MEDGGLEEFAAEGSDDNSLLKVRRIVQQQMKQSRRERSEVFIIGKNRGSGQKAPCGYAGPQEFLFMAWAS